MCIRDRIYTTEQESAGDEAAVKGRLLEAIEAIPGFGDTGVTVGELKITAFVPASEGTSDRPDGMDAVSYTHLENEASLMELRVMDEARRQAGIIFPADRK